MRGSLGRLLGTPVFAAALFAILLFCTPAPALAQDAVTETTVAGPWEAGSASPDGSRLTIPEAARRALAVSFDVELARFAVLEAEMALREAEIDQLAGRPRSELVNAQRALEEARLAYVDALVDAALQVEEAYYQVLRTAELRQIQRNNLEQAERQRQVAETRFAAGLIAKHDLDQVRLRRDEADIEWMAAQSREEDARRALAQLLGLPDLEGIRLASERSPFQPLAITLAEALAESAQSRSEIGRAARALEAAEEKLSLAKSTFAPPAELRRNELEIERARINLQKAEASVSKDVKASFDLLMSAATKVELNERALQLAERRLEIAKARYDAGIIPLVDLVAAETEAQRARLDAAAAIWDYNLEEARFLRKIGRTQLPPLPEAIEVFIAGWTD